MPAKAYRQGAYWYVRVNYQGESRSLTSWMGRKFDDQGADFIAGTVNNLILTGHFKWSDWFAKDRQKLKIGNLCWQWLDSRKLRPATINKRTQMLKRFILPAIGDRLVSDLRKADFHWIRKELGDTAQGQLTRNICQSLINWAYHQELTDKPVYIDPIKLHKRKTPYIDIRDRTVIWEKLPDQYRAPALLSLEMGMRVGEICALQWDAIDWHQQGIRVIRAYSDGVIVDGPKEGDEKWLPMQGGVEKALKRLQAVRKSPFVFCHPTGSKIWTNQLSQAWKVAARSVGLPQTRLHDNRHSYITDKLDEGYTMREVAALVGHHSLKTTEGYDRPRIKHLRRVVGIDPSQIRGMGK